MKFTKTFRFIIAAYIALIIWTNVSAQEVTYLPIVSLAGDTPTVTAPPPAAPAPAAAQPSQ